MKELQKVIIASPLQTNTITLAKLTFGRYVF